MLLLIYNVFDNSVHIAHNVDIYIKSYNSSFKCRPMRDLKYDNFLYRRLRFASSTVNKVLSLRDLTKLNCDILYSEDFQHNQLIENRLRIINPFM